MLDFLRWLLSQREISKGGERTGATARQRLQVVLIQDRLDLPAVNKPTQSRQNRRISCRANQA